METETSGGERRRRPPAVKRQRWRNLPYLLASLGADAAGTCPVRLWLPGVVDGRKPSVGHLLSAGQLPPAELLVRLLVHHQQPRLRFHSLDPLHHLGQAGWRGAGQRSALWAAHGRWHHPGLAQDHGQAAGLPAVGGWTERPAGSTLHPRGLRQLPPSLPRTPDTGCRDYRITAGTRLGPGSCPRRAGKLDEAAGLEGGAWLSFRVSVCVHVCAGMHPSASGFASQSGFEGARGASLGGGVSAHCCSFQ